MHIWTCYAYLCSLYLYNLCIHKLAFNKSFLMAPFTKSSKGYTNDLPNQKNCGNYTWANKTTEFEPTKHLCTAGDKFATNTHWHKIHQTHARTHTCTHAHTHARTHTCYWDGQTEDKPDNGQWNTLVTGREQRRGWVRSRWSELQANVQTKKSLIINIY